MHSIWLTFVLCEAGAHPCSRTLLGGSGCVAQMTLLSHRLTHCRVPHSACIPWKAEVKVNARTKVALTMTHVPI